MKESVTIMALRTTRVNDTTSVLTAYSPQLGRVAFALPEGRGREAARRRALLMPLSVAECVASRRPGRDLMLMSQMRPLEPLLPVYTHPVRNAVAIFVADLLTALLRDTPPDPALFDYLRSATRQLAEASGRAAANFHICFMIHLSRHMGIEPDISGYAPGRFFDMNDATFVGTPSAQPGRTLDAAESAAVGRIMRITFANMGRFAFTPAQRNRVIDLLMRYYSIHCVDLRAVKSLDILRSLF